MRLQDDVAIVTGAAQGIGRAIALGLAEEGAQVVVADRQAEKARAVAAEIEAMGRRGLGLAVDVRDLGALQTMVDAAVEAFGTLDILVNNAGIALPTPFFETTEHDWDRMMAVNLKGVFFATQYAARVMREKGHGKIVNLASTSAFVAGRQEAPYAVSKAGVKMLTAAVSAELAADGINVNAIAPGLIKTPMTETYFPDEEAFQARVDSKIPMGRVGVPRDLVGAVVFLCSTEADYVTGHTLVVDGGWLTQ